MSESLLNKSWYIFFSKIFNWGRMDKLMIINLNPGK
jgi:hypothetical protein